jgi:hypothetical protein
LIRSVLSRSGSETPGGRTHFLPSGRDSRDWVGWAIVGIDRIQRNFER